MFTQVITCNSSMMGSGQPQLPDQRCTWRAGGRGGGGARRLGAWKGCRAGNVGVVSGARLLGYWEYRVLQVALWS